MPLELSNDPQHTTILNILMWINGESSQIIFGWKEEDLIYQNLWWTNHSVPLVELLHTFRRPHQSWTSRIPLMADLTNLSWILWISHKPLRDLSWASHWHLVKLSHSSHKSLVTSCTPLTNLLQILWISHKHLLYLSQISHGPLNHKSLVNRSWASYFYGKIAPK